MTEAVNCPVNFDDEFKRCMFTPDLFFTDPLENFSIPIILKKISKTKEKQEVQATI